MNEFEVKDRSIEVNGRRYPVPCPYESVMAFELEHGRLMVCCDRNRHNCGEMKACIIGDEQLCPLIGDCLQGSYSERLKRFRVSHGMTKTTMAILLNVSASFYSDLEKGIARPSLVMRREIESFIEGYGGNR